MSETKTELKRGYLTLALTAIALIVGAVMSAFDKLDPLWVGLASALVGADTVTSNLYTAARTKKKIAQVDAAADAGAPADYFSIEKK